MAFLTNVHLKNADLVDYDTLDREMEKEHFDKLKLSVRVDQGREYNFQGGTSLQDVTAAAYRAAARTGKKYTFTVIKLKS